MSMNPSDIYSEAKKPIPRTIIASAVLAVVSMLLLVVAGLLIAKISYSNRPIEFSSGNPPVETADSAEPIVVDVSGAVVMPGLYKESSHAWN